MDDASSRFRRALLGFCLGDAYGAPRDFKPPCTVDDVPIAQNWTENADILACLMSCRGENIPRNLLSWAQRGFEDRGPAKGNLPKVARMCMSHDDWMTDPHAGAREIVGRGNIAIINLPVATSIYFAGAPRNIVENYVKMFVTHDSATNVAHFYSRVINHLLQTDRVNTANIFAASGLPAEDLTDYSQMCLIDLEVTNRPLHVVNSLKIICYCLRIVEYAQDHNTTPDIDRVLRWVAAAGGDASNNCAIAGSIVATVCPDIDISHLTDGEWMINLINRALNVEDARG